MGGGGQKRQEENEEKCCKFIFIRMEDLEEQREELLQKIDQLQETINILNEHVQTAVNMQVQLLNELNQVETEMSAFYINTINDMRTTML